MPERPADTDRVLAALRECAAGTLPPNVAMMRALANASSSGDFEAALDRVSEPERSHSADARFAELRRLWREHPDAFGLVKAVLQQLDHTADAAGCDALAYWRSAFDRAAAISPDAGVALYTLGDRALSDRTAAEIVSWLLRERLMGAGSRILDMGCGAGRVALALAAGVECVVALDISEAMLRAARTRGGDLPNVALLRTGGRDLACLGGASFDCVLAVDSFPYLVLAGGRLPRKLVAEAARVLRPGGALAILNYSYRGDLAADRLDVARYASENALSVTIDGVRPFDLWDGAAFVLRKSS